MVIHILPPEVKSPECTTAFEAGDVLLIDARLFPGSQPREMVVTVEKVSVSIYALSEGRTHRSVIYGVRCENARGPFGNAYQIFSEAELQRRFLNYVWCS